MKTYTNEKELAAVVSPMHHTIKERLEEFGRAVRSKRVAMFVDGLAEDEKRWARRLNRFASPEAHQDGGRTWLQYLPKEDFALNNRAFRTDMTVREVAVRVASQYDQIIAFFEGLLKTGQLTPPLRETIEELADQHDRQKADLFVKADQITKI